MNILWIRKFMQKVTKNINEKGETLRPIKDKLKRLQREGE